MSYATKQDMVDRFGERELVELTDRADPPADAVIDAVLDRALTDAGETVDSYIRGKYDLAAAHGSSRLVRLACDIARYFLHEDRVPERVEAAYKDAIQFLRDVQAGRATLDFDEAPAEPGTGAQVVAPDRVFSRDTLRDF